MFRRGKYEKPIAGGYEPLLTDLTKQDEDKIETIVKQAHLGIESEASIWQVEKMKHYGRDWWIGTGKRKPLQDLKSWTAPTLIVEEEDFPRLQAWREAYGLPIYIVHFFYNAAYMLAFERLESYLDQGIVKPRVENYGRVTKVVYSTYYGLAVSFGTFSKVPEVVPYAYQTSGGKCEAELYFDGGQFSLNPDVIEEWLSPGYHADSFSRPQPTLI